MIYLYGFFLLVAFLNWALMKRPTTGHPAKVAILIPARNEAENLRRLLPALGDLPIFLYDDASTDETAEIARTHGATVLQGTTLPPGWTGKNHACHRLAQAAAQASDADWWLFLDADVYPDPDFPTRIQTALGGAKCPVVTGFPRGLPGRGIEPLFLAWVGWILLATNPFGLVSLTGKGHNRFLNGQFIAWKPTTYTDLWPHEQLKGAILEDVRIGRLLAKQSIKVEVWNASKLLSVRMYDTWRQAFDGMSKNSFEITGSVPGTLFLALFMIALGGLWAIQPVSVVLLILSGFFTARIMRYPLWVLPFFPICLTIAGITLIRSLIWHKTGRVQWKGRAYSTESGANSPPPT
jgi:hypothetical protein